MIAALKENRELWTSAPDRRMGFIRAVRGPDGDARLTGFLMDAKRAATNTAQLPGTAPAQLIAARRRWKAIFMSTRKPRKPAYSPSEPRAAHSSL
jgi:hypothetical protein